VFAIALLPAVGAYGEGGTVLRVAEGDERPEAAFSAGECQKRRYPFGIAVVMEIRECLLPKYLIGAFLISCL